MSGWDDGQDDYQDDYGGDYEDDYQDDDRDDCHYDYQDDQQDDYHHEDDRDRESQDHYSGGSRDGHQSDSQPSSHAMSRDVGHDEDRVCPENSSHDVSRDYGSEFSGHKSREDSRERTHDRSGSDYQAQYPHVPENRDQKAYEGSGTRSQDYPEGPTRARSDFYDTENALRPSAFTPYTITSRGVNSQGNRYDTREQPCGPAYRYSNRDGSWLYKNGDGSKYYDNGKNQATYTTPDGRVFTRQTTISRGTMEEETTNTERIPKMQREHSFVRGTWW